MNKVDIQKDGKIVTIVDTPINVSKMRVLGWSLVDEPAPEPVVEEARQTRRRRRGVENDT